MMNRSHILSLLVSIIPLLPTYAVEIATTVDHLNVKDGFRVELLYSVPKEDQGSWVSICTDNKGRIIVSDQYGSLYRFAPPATGQVLVEEAVQKIDLPIGNAHGLLYAFDSLYCIVSNEKYQGRGLYRVRDTTGDDQFDQVEQLLRLEQGGEHGPHSVVLSPDGESLYVIVGNQTILPPMQSTRVPPVWGEDQVLPRVYGRGFMRGVQAPRGWVAKTDPEGKSWELIATGFRNQYDAAFNKDGELFTYDADMEWDVNTPWYRPTRVCHVVSGAEFGWRNGSAKWPSYYEDSLPPTIDIGPGSPTGVCFGYGTKFPHKYQQAFYICDWSYGKLYAVHLEPNGSSYKAITEEFISAQPLPLTDLCVHPGDGALYFNIGGRRTQSGLYRVTYTGDESTDPLQDQPNGDAIQARQLRQQLESYHGKIDPEAVPTAWPHLSSSDRFIRFAARTAIESQPAIAWKDRVIVEKDSQASLLGAIALIRTGYSSLGGEIFGVLQKHKWDKLTNDQRLIWVRAYQLYITRIGITKAADVKKIVRRLEPNFPCDDPRLNLEISQVLAALDAPKATPKIVDLLTQTPTQEAQIAYAKDLRVMKKGWTMADRERYFQWFIRAATYKGGASFGNFVENVKKEAVANLSEEDKATLKHIIDAQPKYKQPQFDAKPRDFFKMWAMEDFEGLLGVGLEGNRDHKNGRNLFGAAACYSCHRFNEEGGAVGPDLTSAAGRFSPTDLLESIIDPSKEISDQYNATVITKNNGDQVMGRIVNLDGDQVNVNTDMLDPNEQANIKRSDIKSMGPSKVSMMPPGLLSTLTEDDVLDLLAYLLSGGNADHPLFQ